MDMNTVNLIINDQPCLADEGDTILSAAKKAHIEIPTLCYHPDLPVKANCRVCIVEVVGMKHLQASCMTQVKEGMVVHTNNARVREARTTVLELILANHEQNCAVCHSSSSCELRRLSEEMNIRENRYENVLELLPIMTGNPSIVRDMNKCIKCGRCIQVCNEVQKVGAIYNIGRSTDMVMGTAYNDNLSEVSCTYCGQCINVCPVGAIYEKDHIQPVLDALEDPSKYVIAQIAPSVRVSIGEMFGKAPGSIVTGKMPAVLRKLGFDRVFDTNFTADLTIMEEGTELLSRIQNGGVLPMLTSCSPGWINYIEQFYPDLIDHLSTCKSPQQMFGALAKTYYADQMGLLPQDLVVVSIMPCTAKKYEAKRQEMVHNGVADVDYVLTTREFGEMIAMQGYDLEQMSEESFDDPFGITTGAAVLFGATGGVMEAALRSVYEIVTKETLETIDFHSVRGMDGTKEATVMLGDLPVKVAVTNSLSHAKVMMEKIQSGQADYHFIEVMCCPGGCIGGGGQPKPTTNAIRQDRIKGIYEADAQMPIRKSHENPAVLKLYQDYLGEPNSERAHHLLHTTYVNRGRSL